MASAEHVNLSNFIKKVHESLRIKSLELGSDTAWENHCNDEITLNKYAQSMKELATNYWDKNLSENESRVTWTYNTILEYFREKISTIRDKETAIAQKLGLDVNQSNISIDGPWKLLDVGSCYNPFGNYDRLLVTPIDLAPASNDVLKCDFLKVEIADQTFIENNNVSRFKRDCFDVVVFCLLLEYLPNTDQRKACCLNAYELLRTEGILVIISPDSNHVGSNAKLMKSWRYILAQMGFSRIKYEKLCHVHCMVFRKSFLKDLPIRWAELNRHLDVYDKILIPQDFKPLSANADTSVKSKAVEQFDFSNEMPFHDIFDSF